MRERVSLIYSDRQGNLIEDLDLSAVGLNGNRVEVADETWIELPAGGELVRLPGRAPMGFNEKTGEVEVVEGSGQDEVMALAAILPVGLTRCLLPGYEVVGNQEMPLFGYAAAGTKQGRIVVAALPTDADLKWNPVYYNTNDLPRLVESKQTEFPTNRILKQLARCALEYHCLTAQNIFYRRWEAGIPVSPRCNADCRGCISMQPAECCPAPQSRIGFIPEEREVVELAVDHLEEASEAIISFGQGCEGEPSLQKELLTKAIRAVRQKTVKGTININTNAGLTEAVKAFGDSGLDSIRVSLFSAIGEHYEWYHRPQGYRLDNVRDSLRYASENGLQTALNLLFFPGFTNQVRETEALYELIAATGVCQVQLRNLNLDPEKLAGKLVDEELPTVAEWIGELKKTFPQLEVGNYTKAGWRRNPN